MIEKVQLKGGICEPSSDIPLNWRDMRSEFGYTTLYSIVSKSLYVGKSTKI